MEATTNWASDHHSTIYGHLLGDAEEVPAGVTIWASWAWAVLASAGDAPTEVDEHAAPSPVRLVTLAGLSHIFDLFEHVAAGHTSRLAPGSPSIITTVRDTPKDVNAGHDELRASDNSRRPDELDRLLHEVIETRAEQLRARLCAILGVSDLYAALCAALMGKAMPERPVTEVRSGPDDLDDFYAACESTWPIGERSVDTERILMWLEGSWHLD